jgi:hypothetical protein
MLGIAIDFDAMLLGIDDGRFNAASHTAIRASGFDGRRIQHDSDSIDEKPG